jgi:hypothetical protein
MNADAEIWKAKYDALAAGVGDITAIHNAEKLVEAAMRQVAACPIMMDFGTVVDSMIRLVRVQETPTPIAVQAKALAMWTALSELVELKDVVKDADPEDYERRKPLAWEAARKVLEPDAGISILNRLNDAEARVKELEENARTAAGFIRAARDCLAPEGVRDHCNDALKCLDQPWAAAPQEGGKGEGP